MNGRWILRAAGWVLSAVALFAVAPAVAQMRQQVVWCTNKDNAFAPELVIQSCTATIDSGRYSGKGSRLGLLQPRQRAPRQGRL